MELMKKPEGVRRVSVTEHPVTSLTSPTARAASWARSPQMKAAVSPSKKYLSPKSVGQVDTQWVPTPEQAQAFAEEVARRRRFASRGRRHTVQLTSPLSKPWVLSPPNSSRSPKSQQDTMLWSPLSGGRERFTSGESAIPEADGEDEGGDAAQSGGKGAAEGAKGAAASSTQGAVEAAAAAKEPSADASADGTAAAPAENPATTEILTAGAPAAQPPLKPLPGTPQLEADKLVDASSEASSATPLDALDSAPPAKAMLPSLGGVVSPIRSDGESPAVRLPNPDPSCGGGSALKPLPDDVRERRSSLTLGAADHPLADTAAAELPPNKAALAPL